MKLTKELKRQIDSFFKNISEEEFLKLNEQYGFLKTPIIEFNDLKIDDKILGIIDHYGNESWISTLLKLYELRKANEDFYGPVDLEDSCKKWTISFNEEGKTLKVIPTTFKCNKNPILEFISPDYAGAFLQDQKKLLIKLLQ